MNALKRWNRLRELEALHHGLSSLFGRPAALGPEWVPLVEETEKAKPQQVEVKVA